MSKPDPILSDELNHEGITHGFFTRAGGVSQGIYEGLNVGQGSNDDKASVSENRSRVAAYFGVTQDNLASLYQVHSPDVITLEAPIDETNRPKADGLVTATPGLAIGVLTADCGPVLFLDPVKNVIGGAHAGWKGATGGVLESTISAMENLGASRDNITAVLGPTISSKNYEVGPEFVDNLLSISSENTAYLSPSENAGRSMFDLPAYTLARLNSLGVKANWTGQCTYADEERFFSYRRTTHRNEPDYGRQISVISIKKNK